MKTFGHCSRPVTKRVRPLRENAFGDLLRQINRGKIKQSGLPRFVGTDAAKLQPSRACR